MARGAAPWNDAFWTRRRSTLICCPPASREYGLTEPRNIRRTRFLALARSRGTGMNATAYLRGLTNVRIPEPTHGDYRQQRGGKECVGRESCRLSPCSWQPGNNWRGDEQSALLGSSPYLRLLLQPRVRVRLVVIMC